MTTYKVLLVDDEEEVRNAIEQRINWEELGFEVIGKAQNGVKAMEIAEKLQPDVVITDIKMPYMNGLELARNLKEENPGVWCSPTSKCPSWTGWSWGQSCPDASPI